MSFIRGERWVKPRPWGLVPGRTQAPELWRDIRALWPMWQHGRFGDYSGNNLDGALNGITISGSPLGLVTDLQGSSSSVTIDNSSGLVHVSGDQTMAFLIRMTGDTASGFQHVFYKGLGGSGSAVDVDWRLYVEDNTSGQVFGNINFVGDGFSLEQNPGDWAFDVWRLIVMSVASNTATMYIDNARSLGTVGTSTIDNNFSNTFIGNWASSGTRPFEGQIAFGAIWARALSAQEIMQLWHDPFAMLRERPRVYGYVPAVTPTGLPPAMLMGPNLGGNLLGGGMLH